MKNLIADRALDYKLVIPQVTLERRYGFTDFATLFTGRRTWGIFSQMERFNVQFTAYCVTVPTIAVLALDRLGVHLFVNVQCLDMLQHNSIHDALRAGLRYQIHVDRQVFQQCLGRTQRFTLADIALVIVQLWTSRVGITTLSLWTTSRI